MMTADQIAGMSAEEHSAWIESLDEDEAIVLHTPVGFRYMLVAIADVKVVLSKKIPAEYRLKFLEFLKGHEDMFTAEAIAAVEPFNDEAQEIVGEARKLGRKWLDVVARWEVFNALIALNPSLLTALKMPMPNGYSVRSVSFQ